MPKILCAIRGGETSQKTQDRAIQLAKENDAELLYLFVADTAFMDKTARAFRRDTITREMDHMGEFLLLMALERARKQGVRASLLLRHGDFHTELIEAAREQDIMMLVLGKPAGEDSLFCLKELQALAQEIETETQVKVVFADTIDE